MVLIIIHIVNKIKCFMNNLAEFSLVDMSGFNFLYDPR